MKRGLHVSNYPYQLRIGFTGGCNRNCDFCSVHKRGTKEVDNISYSTFKERWLPNIPAEIKSIVIARDGEPLLNPDLPLIIKELRNQNKQRLIIMFSNGDMLYKNKKLLNNLFDAGLNGIQIDAYTKTDSLYNLLKEQLKSITGCKLFKTCEGSALFLDTTYKSKKIYFVDYHFQDNRKSRTRKLHTNCGNIKLDDNTLKTLPLLKTCSNPFKHIAVSSNGNISVCCADLNNTFSIGHIEQDNLTDVWNGEKLRAVRHLLKNKRRDLIIPCSLCNIITYRDGLYPYYQRKASLQENIESVVTCTTPSKTQLENIERKKHL